MRVPLEAVLSLLWEATYVSYVLRKSTWVSPFHMMKYLQTGLIIEDQSDSVGGPIMNLKYLCISYAQIKRNNGD